jgi:hypothetical protein
MTTKGVTFMLRVQKPQNPNVADLTDCIYVNTQILPENYAALRSGFAGYPSNPRWTVAKYQAWKIGRQLRDAYTKGHMTVRSTDSMLVPIQEGDSLDEKPPSHTLWKIPQIRLIGYQTV